MKLLTRLLPLAAFTPMLAFAQVETGWLNQSLESIRDFIDLLIPFIFALALLVFLWGVFTYFVYGGADEEKRETGRSYMIYGILGFVLMIAVWGIVEVIVNLLGVNEDYAPVIPQTPN